MLKALAEVLGSLLAGAPVREGKGHRQRIFALILILAAAGIALWLRLER